MKEFKATLNKETKITTALVLLILLIAMLLPVILLNGNTLVLALSIFILLPVLFIAYALRPVKYIIDANNLIIVKGIGNKMIERKEITVVKAVTKNDLGVGIRLLGSGGFFGYYGKFSYKKIGIVNAYVVNTEHLIYLKTKNEKQYLVSPDDTLGFVETLSQNSPSITTQNNLKSSSNV